MSIFKKLAKHSSLLLPVATLLILPMIHQPENLKKSLLQPNKLAAFVAELERIQSGSKFIPVPDIDFGAIQADTLRFETDSINANNVLFALFPTISAWDWIKSDWDHKTDSADYANEAVWGCKKCVPQLYIEQNDRTAPSLVNPTMVEKNLNEIQRTFPFERNFTTVTDLQYYQTVDGKQRCVVSFNTCAEIIPVGRFFSGMLGIAVLEKLESPDKKGSIWKVLNFNPQVCFQGNYSQSNSVTHVKTFTDGNYFEVISWLGGTENYQNIDYYLISESNLKTVMFLPGLCRYSAAKQNEDFDFMGTASSWGGEVSVQMKNQQLVASITHSGWYIKDSTHAELSDLPFMAMPKLQDFNLKVLDRLMQESPISKDSSAEKAAAKMNGGTSSTAAQNTGNTKELSSSGLNTGGFTAVNSGTVVTGNMSSEDHFNWLGDVSLSEFMAKHKNAVVYTVTGTAVIPKGQVWNFKFQPNVQVKWKK